VTSITARNWRQLGMTSLPFYFNHGVGSQQFIDGAQGAAEGIRVPVPALLIADSLPATDRQRAASVAYAAAWNEAFTETISSFGGYAHDGLHIYLDAVKRAGGTDKAKVRDALEQTRDFIGVDGIYNMSATDHMGLTLESFKMVEVRSNTWKLID
jgi:branched-chain amino acid transport system substrate-binding protein